MKTFFRLSVFVAGLVVSSTASQAAPAATALSQGLTIVQTCEVRVRPMALEGFPSHGQVRAVINVDATGKLVDCMLVDYTHARYSDAAIEALRRWEYKPALSEGMPFSVRTVVVFDFETHGQVISLSGIDTVDSLVRSIVGVRPTKCIVPASELDSAPKPLLAVSPLAVSLSDQANRPKGVMVDFFIDETGRPRMAAVDIKEDDQMAMASLDAIEHWRFTPPMHKGRPVAVRASQWFDFSKTVVAAK